MLFRSIAIVADAVDRIQRSFKESVMLDDLRRREMIELHFYRESMIIGKRATASDLMRWDFSVMAARSYVLQLSENVKRSLDWKLKNGEIRGVAPVGFINTKDENGKSTVIKDQASAYLVKQLFEEFAIGLCTLTEIAEKANGWGLRTKSGKKLYKQFIHAMICNPFYYGDLKTEHGLFPHKYEPLISKQLWNTCQRVLEERHKKPFKYGGKDFILRGLVTDAVTGRVLSCDTKTRTYKSGGVASWTYLYSTNPDDHKKRLSIREEYVLEEMQKVFDRMVIPNDIYENTLETLRSGAKSEREYHGNAIKSLNREREALNKKIDKLVDILLDGKVDQNIFDRRMKVFKERIEEIEEELKIHENGDDSYIDCLKSLIKILNGIGDDFKGSNNDRKRSEERRVGKEC